jgi:hypothetical protein
MAGLLLNERFFRDPSSHDARSFCRELTPIGAQYRIETESENNGEKSGAEAN